MKLVFLDDTQIGAILAKNIYGSDGSVLLSKGIVLNSKYISRLKDFGIESAYVVNKKIQHFNLNLEINDLISDTVRQETIKIVKENLVKIIDESNLNYTQIAEAVNQIIDELLSKDVLIFNLTDIRSFDNYTFAHSVNVAILAISVGISLKLSRNELKILGIGAFLHDIGKIKIPIHILNKPGKLNDEEYNIIKHHPEYGFEFIRRNKNFNIISAHIAYQHHEKFDGSGYPQGLKGKQIHKLARITSIADVYDALTANRPYRKAYLPHKALEFILGGSATFFDPDIVKAFLKCISPYPIGTIVRLNTGEIGVVLKQNQEALLRPVILVYEKDGKELDKPKEKNLVDFPTVLVQDIVTD
ncbi:MAG: HD-GYP domain-containing protein [bacterium]